MAYVKKDNDKEVKWYSTKILNAPRETYLVWLLQEMTEWGNHTSIYKQLQKNSRPMKC